MVIIGKQSKFSLGIITCRLLRRSRVDVRSKEMKKFPLDLSNFIRHKSVFRNKSQIIVGNYTIRILLIWLSRLFLQIFNDRLFFIEVNWFNWTRISSKDSIMNNSYFE